MSRVAAAITTPVTTAAKQPGRPRLVPVDKNVLREIITRHIVSIRLVNCGTVDAPRWEGEYYSFDFPLVADTSKEPNEYKRVGWPWPASAPARGGVGQQVRRRGWLRSCERKEMKRPKLFKDSKIRGDCCERNGQAKRVAGLEIDDQIDLGGLLHRPGGSARLLQP
jgi:hypothetical protein